MAVMEMPHDVARRAYGAYGESTGRKNYQGLPMPAWEELPGAIQRAWVAATTAARQAAPLGRVVVAGRWELPIVGIRLSEGQIEITAIVAGYIPANNTPRREVTLFGVDGRQVCRCELSVGVWGETSGDLTLVLPIRITDIAPPRGEEL